MNEHEKLIEIIDCALKCFQKELPSYGTMLFFPKEYCEEVSSILLSILEDEGYTEFKMIKGSNNKKNKHHFWLESENYIIDLTAHQFDDINQPFILISKNDYPLFKKFPDNIHIRSINTNWEFLMNLMYSLKDKFYSEYYKK
ncbi:hypothetical protein MER72_04390 [Acinetobacter baumannii]|nr:hypothetical protein [Acinetobacter baumannii]